jgi:hypothetical protein
MATWQTVGSEIEGLAAACWLVFSSSTATVTT